MLKYFLLAISLSQCGHPAFAQQTPDPGFMQRAMLVLQAQRNNALDGQAACEAARGGLAEEIEKLKVRIKELEDKK